MRFGSHAFLRDILDGVPKTAAAVAKFCNCSFCSNQGSPETLERFASNAAAFPALHEPNSDSA